MNALYDIKDKLETFKDYHQEWMDEREDETDGRFSQSETGERAEDEQYSFGEWFDQLDNMVTEMEEML